MALAWNTRQLIAASSSRVAGRHTPIEFHFLSRRELYDCTFVTADRHHSSAGEWALHGDHHWYTMAVITRPVDAIPQELCLYFDCFDRTETFRSGSSDGPPIDDVALEFGTLVTLFAREPLLPLGTRRMDGKPFNRVTTLTFPVQLHQDQSLRWALVRLTCAHFLWPFQR